MANETENDELLKHELLDRLHCVQHMFEELVSGHPMTHLMVPEIHAVSNALGAAYQKAGAIRFGHEAPKATSTGPAVWLDAEGKAHGRVSDEQVEAILLESLADVRKRSGLVTGPEEVDPLEPVSGDLLPPMGSTVLIHLASQDAWVEHTVVGYYVWPAQPHQIKGDVENSNAHRVFVRVRDAEGYLNARLLRDVKPVGVKGE